MDAFIRLAGAADAALLTRLQIDFNREFDSPSPPAGILESRYRALLSDPDGFALVATQPTGVYTEPSEATGFATRASEATGFATGASEATGFATGASEATGFATGASEATGFATVTLRPTIYCDGPLAVLDELYVVPGLRDRGIGTALLLRAIGEVRARGGGEMHINVDEVDVDTRRFYERHGFVNVEPGTDYRMLCYLREL